jgi:anti-sigma factor ChrR (cupin superfamily)
VNLIASISNQLQPIALPNPRRAKLWLRVVEFALLQKPDSMRAEQSAWQTFLPGIEIKVLHTQANTETAIWRMQPGAKIPSHPHAHDEECLILSGSLLVERVRYQAGDFLMAKVGQIDPTFYAPDGAMLLIRAGLRPQLNRSNSPTSP